MSGLVCDREFIGSIEGASRRIVAEWMTPSRDRGDWRCDWAIQGLSDHTLEGRSFGVDPAQALLLAMSAVRLELEAVDPGVRWTASEAGTGLPGLPGLPDVAARQPDRQPEPLARG